MLFFRASMDEGKERWIFSRVVFSKVLSVFFMTSLVSCIRLSFFFAARPAVRPRNNRVESIFVWEMVITLSSRKSNLNTVGCRMGKTILIKADHILCDGSRMRQKGSQQLRMTSDCVSFAGIQSLFLSFYKIQKRKVQKRQRPVNDEKIYEQ